MNLEDIVLEYRRNLPRYERLKKNAVEVIEVFLREQGVDVFSVYGRVKTEQSLLEKIARKSYDNVFAENTDFVGIRIILFFPEDVEQVCKILTNELSIVEESNVESRLEVDQFGYRSTHLIATIPKTWSEAPNYRELGAIPFEVQIRTILMHAWAEVEHKLQYKNELDVPTSLRRQLYRLSAKFEEADEQFQSLKEEISKYRIKVVATLDSNDSKALNFEINLETLHSYLVQRYPDTKASKDPAQGYSDLILELSKAGYKTISEVDDALKGTDSAVDAFESDKSSIRSQLNIIGRARVGLSIRDKKYREARVLVGKGIGQADYSKYEAYLNT